MVLDYCTVIWLTYKHLSVRGGLQQIMILSTAAAQLEPLFTTILPKSDSNFKL